MDFWVFCAKCGSGHSLEDFAFQDPQRARAFAIRELPKGAEENNIETAWVPRCKECGNETFYVQLDPDDMVEMWDRASESEFALPGTMDRKGGLLVWKERARQQEDEFQQWRAQRHQTR